MENNEQFKTDLIESNHTEKFEENIEDNLDSVDDEEDDEEEPLEKPIEEALKIVLDRKDRSLFEIKRLIEKGSLLVQPKFQRKYVWDDKLASRLIESIILGLPIPLIFTAEIEENDRIVEVVIDGQQRIYSINRYMNNEFSLKGLEIIGKDFKNKKFSEIEQKYQQIIEDYTLSVVKIKHDSDEDVKYHLFSRINRGSVNLSAQELRNCIYRGKLNEMIIELSKYDIFKMIFQKANTTKSNRMQDVELILRFIALYDRTPDHYRYPMKSFLNHFMEKNRNPDDKQIQEWSEVFKKTISAVFEVFGDMPFKREDFLYDFSKKKRKKKTQGRKSLLNEALYDCIMYVFSFHEKGELIKIKDAIQEELIYLLSNDQDFQNAISGGKVGSTSSVQHLKRRIEIFRKSIDNLIKIYKTNQGSRFYTHEIKMLLYEKQNKCCFICGNLIENIKFAELHHIEEYWRGGKTIPENASLVHRYCNRAQKSI